MKRLVLSVLLVAASAYAAPAPFPKTKADRRTDQVKIQGLWEVVSSTTCNDSGERMSGYVGEAVVAIADDLWWWFWPQDLYWKETIRLYPAKSPKEIDFRLTGPPSVLERPTKGIYKLEGDYLTICLPADGDVRPQDFRLLPNRRIILLRRP